MARYRYWLSPEFTSTHELGSAGAGVLPALSKRLETRLIESQRISTPDNHPDVVADVVVAA